MKNKLIAYSMKIDLPTMVELSVATDILGFRSVNSMVYQIIKNKIREAKQMVDEKEFAEMVEKQKEITLARSEKKTKEQIQMIGELKPKSGKTIPLLEKRQEKRKTG